MSIFVENVDCLSVNKLKNILPDTVETGKIEIIISEIGISQEVEITSSPGSFGGFIRWFICPGCEKRVGKLYLPYGKCAFLCRHCHSLKYRAQLYRDFRKTQYEKKRNTILEKRREEQLKLLQNLFKMIKKNKTYGK